MSARDSLRKALADRARARAEFVADVRQWATEREQRLEAEQPTVHPDRVEPADDTPEGNDAD